MAAGSFCAEFCRGCNRLGRSFFRQVLLGKGEICRRQEDRFGWRMVPRGGRDAVSTYIHTYISHFKFWNHVRANCCQQTSVDRIPSKQSAYILLI